MLSIKSLQTHFVKREGTVKAVVDVDLNIHQGETLGLVGESGSGKTVTALSIVKLVPRPGRIISGTVEYKDRDITNCTEKEMSRIRGRDIGIILQDPGTALNPVMPVGEQISEVIRTHFTMKRKEAKQKTYELMRKVQLPNVEYIYEAYAHQLSGGLKQRILIAIALACRPSLVIADEPTTALDVSIQSQILALLKDLKKEFTISLLLITHDLSIVAEMADRVAVMYAGRIVEQAPVLDLFTNPIHPYTRALLNAVPKIDFSQSERSGSIAPLAGRVPDMMNLPRGCTFHPRCPIGDASCQEDYPGKTFLDNGRVVTCFKCEV